MEKHGRGKRRTFSAEYKAEAVRLAREILKNESGTRGSYLIDEQLGSSERSVWLRRAAVRFLVLASPVKNVARGRLRTCDWRRDERSRLGKCLICTVPLRGPSQEGPRCPRSRRRRRLWRCR